MTEIPPIPPTIRGLAVAWLLKEDWPRWLTIDPQFQPDYNVWLRRMEDAIKQLQSRGQSFEKVVIDPDEFLGWTRVNGGKVDSNARAAFAAMKMAIKRDTH